MAQGSINNHYEILIIGGSAGSLNVMMELLPKLPSDLNLAIVLVMHRMEGGDSMLEKIFSATTPWPVKEAEEKEAIEPRTVYIAPAGYHLLIEKNKTFSLDFSEKIHYCRPAIDATLETASETYRNAVVAILLSGANEDGTHGLQTVSAAGGLTIVQDPAEAVVSFMPAHAIQKVNVAYIAGTQLMIEIISRLNRG